MSKNPLFKEATYVSENFDSVEIVPSRIKEISSEFAKENFEVPSFDYYNYPERGFGKINNYFAAFNAINFYFSDKQGRFSIKRDDKEILGSSAAAMIMTENKSFFSDAEELKELDNLTFDFLFTGSDGRKIPRSDWRVNHLNEFGTVLSSKYGGSIDNLVEDSNHLLFDNGKGFVERMMNEFDSYHDVSSYKEKTIHFAKRAQLLAGMIHGRAVAEGGKGFSDIDNLSVYADYVLPMIFQFWGLLKIPQSAEKNIEAGKYFERESAFEVEYRAATIRIADLMVNEINKLRPADEKINNMMLDTYLWGLGRKLRKDYNLKHILVETTAY